MGKTTNPRTVYEPDPRKYPKAPVPVIADAAKLLIDAPMRVGIRTFKVGASVAEVLDAAKAAYIAQPVTYGNVASSEDNDPVRAANRKFLADVQDIIGGKKYDRSMLLDVLEGFMVTSVSQIELEDREAFKARLREKCIL